jgi:hypothetical protein
MDMAGEKVSKKQEWMQELTLREIGVSPRAEKSAANSASALASS